MITRVACWVSPSSLPAPAWDNSAVTPSDLHGRLIFFPPQEAVRKVFSTTNQWRDFLHGCLSSLTQPVHHQVPYSPFLPERGGAEKEFSVRCTDATCGKNAPREGARFMLRSGQLEMPGDPSLFLPPEMTAVPPCVLP